MQATVQDLHDYIARIAPIEGVSVKTWDVRETWRIDFKPEATPDQRDAATKALYAFDPILPDPPQDEPKNVTNLPDLPE